MYKVLNIDGTDYKLEYTMEAALFGECTEIVTEIIEQISEASSGTDKSLPPEELVREVKERMRMYIKTISCIPKKVLTLFYAGLMEHHGTHFSGDGTVRNEEDAKKLLTQFLKERKGEDEGDFFGVLNMIMGQMEEDGFFDLTGLNKAFQVKKTPRVPQDRKKKETKVSENKS